ncbi:MAG: hypothetical protein Q7T55_25440, partial [Solirubrobacteraceae bacterium]|nr:hypothetical protein [Solirubrobacteraceae bacterium]
MFWKGKNEEIPLFLGDPKQKSPKRGQKYLAFKARKAVRPLRGKIIKTQKTSKNLKNVKNAKNGKKNPEKQKPWGDPG